MLLAQTLKEGAISLQTNGTENIQLQVEKNRIDANFLQKETLKTLLELETQTNENSILTKLKTAKNIAEKLKQAQLTLTISYKGQKVITFGAEAHPTISQMITGTNAIEVNNLIELLKLVE